MSKAKPIDRVAYTKDGSIYAYPPAPIEVIETLSYDKEQGAFIGHVRPGVEICPVCGAEILHESGCVRCMACGWSRC